MKNQYLPTVIGMYINYIVHGIGVIIISQNQNALMDQWNTNLTGIGAVISMLGIGRLIAIVFSGPLSDKFGRKPFIYLGMITYIIYFVGLVYTNSVVIASILAVVAGISNSFLDSGTYPALMESYPKNAGTANVLIKAFVQIGQFILPLIIGFISGQNLWFGWAFLIAAILLVINMVYLWRLPFPDQAQEKEDPEAVIQAVSFKEKPKFAIEGVAFVLYGFISQSTFYIISQFVNTYGAQVAGMTEGSANSLISYYSMGSLLCVAFTAIIATKIRSINLVVVYTFFSFLSILMMWLWPTPMVMQIGSALVGFFAAGGVMQLGLTVMGEMFPAGKGTITSIFYTFGSIASFVIPNIATWIANRNMQGIMLLNTVIAGIGFILAIIVFIRYYKVVDTKSVISDVKEV